MDENHFFAVDPGNFGAIVSGFATFPRPELVRRGAEKVDKSIPALAHLQHKPIDPADYQMFIAEELTASSVLVVEYPNLEAPSFGGRRMGKQRDNRLAREMAFWEWAASGFLFGIFVRPDAWRKAIFGRARAEYREKWKNTEWQHVTKKWEGLFPTGTKRPALSGDHELFGVCAAACVLEFAAKTIGPVFSFESIYKMEHWDQIATGIYKIGKKSAAW